MNPIPYLYQLKDVRQIERWGGRVILGHEMGLGKSFICLLYLNRNPDAWPAVVVCPATLKWNWAHEAATHFGIRGEVLDGMQPPKRVPRCRLLIVNYDILHPSRHGDGWLEVLKNLNPKTIILDECQAVSSPKAKRSRACRELCKGVPNRLALSGTPMMNRPAELWSVLNMVRPDLFPSAWPFLHKFCGPRKAPWGWEFNGATNMEELRDTLTSNLLIRRRKEDVLTELPPRRRIVVPLPLSDRGEYEQASKDFLTWISKTSPTGLSGAARAEGLVKAGHLKRLTARLKLPAVMDWIDTFLDGGGKLVQFAVHKAIVTQLKARYRSRCVVIDGSTSLRDRKETVHAFQNGRKIDLLIGNLQAAGVGLTLTASSTTAHCELGWKPAEHLQADDRVHRIGQTRPTEAYYLIASSTIEEKILKLMWRKQDVIRTVIDGGGGDDFNVFDQLVRELQKEGRR